MQAQYDRVQTELHRSSPKYSAAIYGMDANRSIQRVIKLSVVPVNIWLLEAVCSHNLES